MRLSSDTDIDDEGGSTINLIDREFDIGILEMEFR